MAASAGSSDAGPLPPNSPSDQSHHGLLRSLLPGLVTAGAGAAVLALLEHRSGTVSGGLHQVRRHAEEAGEYLSESVPHWWEEAGEATHSLGRHARRDLLSAGAKAAGLVGLLKSLGAEALSSDSAQALKKQASRKANLYATRASKAGKRFARNHPGLAAAGAYGAGKARSFGHEAADRWDEWQHRMFGTPRRRKQEDHTFETVVSALAVLGLGAAAFYLFSQSSRGQRSLTVAQRQAAHLAKVARREAQQMGETLSEGLHAATERARTVVGRGETARTDEQIVSEVRRAIHEKLASASDTPLNVQVASSDGHVTLSGELSESVRDLARKVARSVRGVREVTLTQA